jgi:NAD(P)-dependent dehydrogenase (short-subunit alcohol dehydrogenase family)
MAPEGRSPALEGKCLVVIGGTGGLGISAARAFIRAGARVVAVGLQPDRAKSATEQLGAAACVICSDAAKPETAIEAIAACLKEFKGFDGLYHVAGGSGRSWGDGPLHEITDQAWNKTLDLNLNSLFYSNRAAVRQFLEQKTGGTILNLTSVLGWSPSPQYFATQAYAAAKAAIIGLTRSCAALYARQGIRFNALAPGLVHTPMAERAANNAQIMAFIKTKQPLDGGRIGNPLDLDAAAVYFMSDSSRFTTGQILAVDGGWSICEGQIPASADSY